MNFAEGKGPKQVKRAWPLGKFVTLYGNGVQSNVNPAPVSYRSEERRVGKECRSRWSPYH